MFILRVLRVNLEGFYDGEGRFRSRMILEGFRIPK
jgi:hypothetical protein